MNRRPVTFCYIPDQSEVRRYFGRLRGLSGEEHSIWLQVSHKLFEPSEIECQVSFSAPCESFHRIVEIQGYNLDITVDAPYSGQLRLSMIGGGEYDPSEARFDIISYDVLPLDVEVPGGSEIETIVELTNNRLVSATVDQNVVSGKTLKSKGAQGSLISWADDAASYKVPLICVSEPAVAGQDGGYFLRNRPRLLKSSLLSKNSSIGEILESTELELKDILRLLSFLSREWIDWFKISIIARMGGGAGGKSIFAMRRTKIWEKHSADKLEEPLLGEEDLRDGRVGDLLSALRSSPHVEDIRRAMAFSLSSRHGVGDEGDYLLAFAALETLVNSLDERDPLLLTKDIDWNALEKRVKRCVGEYWSERDIPGELMQLVKEKVSELKRPSIQRKVMFHLGRLGIVVDDLWVDGDGESRFTEGFARAVSQRNLLVHSTSVEDYRIMRSDFRRIQMLFDRLVLKMLQCSALVSSRAIRELRSIGVW